MWYKLVEDGLSKEKSNEQSKLILINNKVDLDSTIDESLIDYFLKMDSKFKGVFKVSCLTKEGINNLSNWLEKELFNS